MQHYGETNGAVVWYKSVYVKSSRKQLSEEDTPACPDWPDTREHPSIRAAMCNTIIQFMEAVVHASNWLL